MLTEAGLPVREDDIEMDVVRLDFSALKSHHFITHTSTWENLHYKLMFAFNLANPHFVRLPAPSLFNAMARNVYSFPEEDLDQYLAAQAARSQRSSWKISNGSLSQAPTGAHRHRGSHSQLRPKS